MALIRAGDAAWAVQRVNRNRLTESIRTRSSVAGNDEGYDRLFANAFLGMSREEKELHAVIRAITVHTFKPLNDELLEWLATDADFRVHPVDHSPRGRLAKYLADLEAHLILWRAKFTAWIPDHPERALVYLADEQRHGLGFPQGGMKLIEAVLHPQGGVGV